MDKEFMKNWRKAYIKMLEDARKAVFQEEQIYARPYIYEEVHEPTKLSRFSAAIDRVVFRIDEEREKKSDNVLVDMLTEDTTKVNLVLRMNGKADSEKADLYNGLYFLYNAIEIMSSMSAISHKSWLLEALRDFCQIYGNNPDITDVDAMIEFIKLAKPIHQLDELERLPREVRDRLNLNLDENLKSFVEQYASEYTKEESLGGPKL